VRYFRTNHNRGVGFYQSVVRPLAFRFDPEWVHGVAGRLIDTGLGGGRFTDPRLEQTLFGVKFANPVGLAAGFDKNAEHLAAWPKFGFGHVEIGTVTARPQPGNARPRMFRLPEDQGLINRMGFNNAGAAAVAQRLQNRGSFPVGINLGKNKDTEPEDAAANYLAAFENLRGQGDYYVINVSSPNTPGLRSLQEKGPLMNILATLRNADPSARFFIKVAPDLTPSTLDDVISVAHVGGATGLIATNTTISRDGLTIDPHQDGGLSGRPVREKSDAVLAHLAGNCNPDLVLIGVGGIFGADDLIRKIQLGAHLTQLYTGWIYGGPQLVPNILRDLARRMDTDGIGHINDYHRQQLPKFA